MSTTAEATADSIGNASTTADDESFIILGNSTCASLDFPGRDISLTSPGPGGEASLVAEDLLRDFTSEGGRAFRAHFKIDHDAVSESSMSLAERAVRRAGGDLRSLALHVASTLDENAILRETLRANNAAVRDKLLQLAAHQDEVIRTQRVHGDKFRETRRLVGHLRAENSKLQDEMERIRANGGDTSSVQGDDAGAGCGADGGAGGGSLACEFVPSPDDDTLHKLTGQLELVERERRKVISENEALTWQKESLERLLDSASAERDRRGDQLAAAQVELRKLTATLQESQSLMRELHDLRGKLRSYSHTADTVATLGDQVRELQARLHDAQTVKLKPSWTNEVPVEVGDAVEGRRFTSNVRLYEKSLQHLSQLLNGLNTSALENLAAVQELSSATTRHRGAGDELTSALEALNASVRDQHAAALQQTGQVRATVDIFDNIFQDYRRVLVRLDDANAVSVTSGSSQASLDTLAAALVSREQELQHSAVETERLRALVVTLQRESDEREHLRAQLQAYRDDFIAERECRGRLACEKDDITSDLRRMQRHNQILKEQLDEVSRINPNIHRHATTRRGAGPRSVPPAFASVQPDVASVPRPATAAANTVYTCPKCAVFVCSQYSLIEEHVERCLDE